MDFLIESLLLILATLIFYIVFASLVYYWRENYVTVLTLPLIYTVHFFLFGFFVIVAFHIIQYYTPVIISFLMGP